MLKNYFKIAFRNLFKHGIYSIIKIGGLAIGLAAALVIILFVKEDLSYDTMHSKYDRIMRVLTIDSAQGVDSKLVGVSQPALGPAVKAELPEVEHVARILNLGKIALKYNDKLLKSEGAFFAESEFFEVFDFKILAGKKEGALDEPGSIVITKNLARRLFGDEDPVGKTVMLDQTTPLYVSAVMANPPAYSHLQFDLLRSLTAPEDQPDFQAFLDSWQGISMHTYLLFNEPTSPQVLNPRLKAIARKNNAYEFFTPTVQSLRDVHLNSNSVLFESNANKSDIINVYVLSTVALLIILLAAVNFINLVTAKATGRAKEMGLRKVVGAEKKQLIIQHLFESVITLFIAAFIALLLTYLILPLLNNIYQRSAEFTFIFEPALLIPIIIFIITVGVLSGLYPALILSSYKPAVVLKGPFKNSAGGIRLRRGLVILQFTISIILIIGTGIVFQQMNYINTKDLGYNREQVITIPLNSAGIINKGRILRSELKRNPDIKSVATSSVQMGQQLGRTGIYPEGEGDDVNYITSIMVADEEYIPTMEMEILQGRNFSLDYPSDSSSAMIINEELAKMLNWKEPLGKVIRLQSGEDQYTEYNVIGLVKNFHFATIRHKVEPMFMLYGRDNSQLSIKVNMDNLSETLAHIENTWKKINPESPYEFAFLDQQLANLYKSEKAFASMFSHFTLLALFIAILGLFALSAFTTEQRRKEIGIRKVMGANTSNLIFILSFDFIKLVLVSFMVAAPVAYFVMREWLKNFSYSINIGVVIFVAAGILAIVIAWFTVSFQAMKAALDNPVNSLRSE